MRKISVILVVGSLLLAAPAFAQEDWAWNKRVFAFGGGGANTGFGHAGFFHLGGGFETVSSVGVGFVVDFGYEQYARANSGFASISPALVYEFPLDSNIRPYARVGIGWITDGSGAAGFWNLGGGVNYWFGERTGLKVEVRDSLQGSNLRYGRLEVLAGVMYRF